ncbi:MAG: hypothetical protein ACYC2Y_10695 [Armatimonadota bacterium]
MSQPRIDCRKCGASNFASSAVCWQCGEPLHASTDGGEPTPPGQEGPQVTSPPPTGPPPAEPPIPTRGGDTQIFVILGFIFAGLSIFCCPPIFGIAAIVMGIIAYTRGNPLGLWVIIAGVVGLVIGVAIGTAIGLNSLRQFQSTPGSSWSTPAPPAPRP